MTSLTGGHQFKVLAVDYGACRRCGHRGRLHVFAPVWPATRVLVLDIGASTASCQTISPVPPVAE